MKLVLVEFNNYTKENYERVTKELSHYQVQYWNIYFEQEEDNIFLIIEIPPEWQAKSYAKFLNEYLRKKDIYLLTIKPITYIESRYYVNNNLKDLINKWGLEDPGFFNITRIENA